MLFKGMLSKRLTALVLSLAVLVTTVIVGVMVNASTEPTVTEATYTFEDGQRLPYSGMEYKTDGGNTYLNYYNATASYSSAGFKTDFILQKSQKYVVTFKYKYNGAWLNRTLRPVIGSKLNAWNFYYCEGNLSMDQANLMDPGKNSGVSLGNTEGEWKRTSFTFDTTAFNSMINDNVKYFGFVFQTGNGAYDLSIDDIHIEYAPENPKVEYDFEYGQDMDYASGYTYAKEADGNRYMTVTTRKGQYDMCCFRTGLELEKNSKYVISFDYKSSGNYLNRPFRPFIGINAGRYNFYDCDQGLNLNSANLYDPDTNNGLSLAAADKWTSTTFVVDTKVVADKMLDGKKYYMSFGFQSSPTPATLSFDNIVVEKIVQDDPNNYVINGGFENGKLMWNDSANFAQLSTDKKNGEKALKLKDGNYSKVYQTLALEKNKNYKLSFWYKGTAIGVTNWALCHDKASTESDYIVSSGALKTASEWTLHETVFTTGNYNALILVLQSCAGCDLIIDDVSVTSTEAAPSATEEFKAAELVDAPLLGKNTLYVAKDGTNLVTDYSFENGNGNWKSLTSDGTLSVTDEKAHDGSYSLKFSAQGLTSDAWSYAYFKVEPETDYYISTWVLGDNWSDTNKCDMYFGIADAGSGYFIYTPGTRGNVKTEQLTCASWDGEWHLVNLKFNTGSAELVAFAVHGKNSVAYFDQISIFKDSDKEKYKAVHQALAKPEISGTVGDMKNCKDGTNLIENGDFSDNSSQFWQSGTNYGIFNDDKMHYYGNFVEIADTGSTKGKALHYKANTSVTGKALQTNYIKWLEVTPNTEYTFSADILILEQGSGSVSLVDNNPFYPDTIATINFGEEYFDEDRKWQNMSVKFKSGDYDKLGIFVMDGGGEAYIDNVRLFESVNAVKETENYPEKITSAKYNVSLDDIISGIAPNTTIKDALSKIDGGSFLKVFDKDGKEITDHSKYIGTGMQVRYMDGVSIYARADVVVGGDVNGDGAVSSADVEKLLKAVTNKLELDELEALAADVDKNEKVDVNDIAKIANHIGARSKLSVMIVE